MQHQTQLSGFTVFNFQVDIEPLVREFVQYDQYFFFCASGVRSAIETAARLVLEDISEYNPLHADRTLMNLLTRDIEIYQSRKPHPYLADSNFLDTVEVICGQIEETTDRYMRSKLPHNQQCALMFPKLQGSQLVFDLRIY